MGALIIRIKETYCEQRKERRKWTKVLCRAGFSMGLWNQDWTGVPRTIQWTWCRLRWHHSPTTFPWWKASGTSMLSPRTLLELSWTNLTRHMAEWISQFLFFQLVWLCHRQLHHRSSMEFGTREKEDIIIRDKIMETRIQNHYLSWSLSKCQVDQVKIRELSTKFCWSMIELKIIQKKKSNQGT